MNIVIKAILRINLTLLPSVTLLIPPKNASHGIMILLPKFSDVVRTGHGGKSICMGFNRHKPLHACLQLLNILLLIQRALRVRPDVRGPVLPIALGSEGVQGLVVVHF